MEPLIPGSLHPRFHQYAWGPGQEFPLSLLRKELDRAHETNFNGGKRRFSILLFLNGIWTRLWPTYDTDFRGTGFYFSPRVRSGRVP